MEHSQSTQYPRKNSVLNPSSEEQRTIRSSIDAAPGERLVFLNPEQVSMIDEALAGLGEFGEIRLVVEKGRIRYLLVQRSIDALKWQPGDAR